MSDMTRKYFEQRYMDREGRNRFIAEELEDYIGKSVLNIGGGGEKYMTKYLSSNVQYYELDIEGSPDLKINLEQEIPLPIETDSYETVICTDVLEHLENLHEVFEELILIASKWVILSFPNSPKGFGNIVNNNVYKGDDSLERRKQYGKFLKFYGLPYEKPKDRHKWFITYTEVEDFLRHYEHKMPFSIEELFGFGYYKKGFFSAVKRMVAEKMFGRGVRKNLFSDNLWCVLRKI